MNNEILQAKINRAIKRVTKTESMSREKVAKLVDERIKKTMGNAKI